MTSPANTSKRILATIRQLSEADRQRILRFTLGILESRKGKRQQRRSRFVQPEINDWRVGR